MKLLAVVTPTYNRAHLLNVLYQSLINQTSKNFKWVIVDDGSNDNTGEICRKFIEENKIEIEYFKKSNGGKHTALNLAIKQVKEEITIIVDSDDELLLNAVEIIERDYAEIKNDVNICGLGYLKQDRKTRKNIGKLYTKNVIIDSFINQRINKNTYGDKCEVFKTQILKQHPFPVFKGEKFISENVVWCSIGQIYKMKFQNIGIYLCEYLEGGLSDGIKKTIYNNPNGAIACYLSMTSKSVSLKYKIKYTIAYIVYSFVAKKKIKEQLKNVNSKILYILLMPIGFFVYKLKRKKYGK